VASHSFYVLKDSTHHNIGKLIRKRIDAELYLRLLDSKVVIVGAFVEVARMVRILL
jgi:hypothetical protein